MGQAFVNADKMQALSKENLRHLKYQAPAVCFYDWQVHMVWLEFQSSGDHADMVAVLLPTLMSLSSISLLKHLAPQRTDRLS